MKKRSLILLLGIFCFYSTNQAVAQQILNGSFENNTLPNCGISNSLDSTYYNHVIKDVIFIPLGSVYVWEHGCNYGGINNFASEGKWFCRLWGDSINHKSDTVFFKLSDSLKVGNPYVFRFSLCSNLKNSKTKDSVLIGITSNTKYFKKIIGGYQISDSTIYRNYSIGFNSDKNFTHIIVCVANSRAYSSCNIDNIRIDTCVSLLGTRRVISNQCNPFPASIRAIKKGIEYNWNYRDTTEQIFANNAGWHIAYIYDSTGCVSIDSIEVIVDSAASKHSINHVMVCAPDSIQLISYQQTNATWQWNTGSSLNYIYADKPGLYICTAVASGCNITDSFLVDVTPNSTLGLPSDTGICNGAPVYLDVFKPYYDKYNWSTGDTTASIQILNSGKYKIIASNSACHREDSVIVVIGSNPPINWPIDSSFCVGDSISLNAFNPSYDSYLWKNGDTTSSIYIHKTDTIWVVATNHYCNATDTIIIKSIIPGISPLKNDTSFCDGTDLVLDAHVSGYTNYLWNNGSNLPQITVNQPKIYTVTISNSICTIYDTINVVRYPKPLLNLPRDTSVCFDELKSILLDAGTWKTYDWYPTGEHTQTINATYPEMYRVVVSDNNNCIGTDTALIEEDCPDGLYFPNAFTPNNDENNDLLQVRGSGIVEVNWKIFDRWGQLIFQTSDLQKTWDGMVNNQPAAADIYVYVITYTLRKNNQQLVQKGNVSLIR